MESNSNEVFLTFDDGPVPGITDFVLNELAKREMKASFFMVGDNIKKHPELATEVLKAGHQIGNHTFHHFNGWKTGKEAYLKDIQDCDRIIQEVLQTQTHLFRPPYGLIGPSQASKVAESKKIIMWSVLSGDYDLSLQTHTILEETVKNTRAGSVVLFHDQEKTRHNLPEILPAYLDFIQEKGWRTAILP
ncbi:polysaccharide deacetylase family protein [Algoriphagus machipongonensis]|nr:polysaccharide deacetylase family protein [Algoriphagus machipongonensis]